MRLRVGGMGVTTHLTVVTTHLTSVIIRTSIENLWNNVGVANRGAVIAHIKYGSNLRYIRTPRSIPCIFGKIEALPLQILIRH